MPEALGNQLPAPGKLLAWKLIQAAVWLVGVTIVALLLLRPSLGIDLFWNILIPVAPALLVIAPGLWRNICPLASTALFSRRLALGSRRRRLSAVTNDRLLLAGVLLLLTVVPLRHVFLDLDGPSTAVMLLTAAAAAVVLGYLFEWKSSWCSGLCPVHPVEKLYGTKPLVSPINAQCHQCERCVDVCADSTPAMDPLVAEKSSRARTLAGVLMFGLFPGFIWGWFQVPDFADSAGWARLSEAFGLPWLCGLVTLLPYLALRVWLGAGHQPGLNRWFAAAAVSCYYWYRLPALVGFGPVPGDGMLVDLSGVLAIHWVWVARFATTSFFLWWMLRRSTVRQSWSQRPEFAQARGSDIMNATVPLLLVFTMAGVAIGQAPASGAETAPSFSYAQARHLLMRAGFGGTPAEIERLRRLGRAAAVQRLVDYGSVESNLAEHQVTPIPMPDRAAFRRLDEDARRKMRQKLRRQDAGKMNGLRAWWIDRMLRSKRPFEERMTLFWHGHFTSGYRDVRNAHHLAQQNQLFRRHATGNFAELLQAVAKDPAMLEYLDNNRNNKRAPNENFAREVMELFSLGEGHYTERDIKEAARAFTGWTFRRGEAGFVFARNNHDFGTKTLLGRTGKFDGEQVIKIILEQPAAPRHLARKLLSYFAVEPTDAELEPYAQLLRTRNYQLKPFFRRLFNSDWFYSDRVVGKLVKSPVVLAVSTMRMMGRTHLSEASRLGLIGACRNIGQELLQPPNVKGWDGGPAWITSSNLLIRGNLTRVMVSGVEVGRVFARGRRAAARNKRRRSGRQARARQLPGTASHRFLAELRGDQVRSTAEVLARLERRFLSVPLAPVRRQALLDFLDGKDGSSALRLRDRTPRWATKVKEALHLLTTTPEFQVS